MCAMSSYYKMLKLPGCFAHIFQVYNFHIIFSMCGPQLPKGDDRIYSSLSTGIISLKYCLFFFIHFFFHFHVFSLFFEFSLKNVLIVEPLMYSYVDNEKLFVVDSQQPCAHVHYLQNHHLSNRFGEKKKNTF